MEKDFVTECDRCKGKWTPPPGKTVTVCPFCGAMTEWSNGYLFSLTHESENFLVAKKDGEPVRVFYENCEGYDLDGYWQNPVRSKKNIPFPDYLLKLKHDSLVKGNKEHVRWGVVTLAIMIEQGYDFSDSGLPPLPYTIDCPEIEKIIKKAGYIKRTEKGMLF